MDFRRLDLTPRELADLAGLMEHLYLEQRLTTAQIAALTRVPERTVRDRLRARGVMMRTRRVQQRRPAHRAC